MELHKTNVDIKNDPLLHTSNEKFIPQHRKEASPVSLPIDSTVHGHSTTSELSRVSSLLKASISSRRRTGRSVSKCGATYRLSMDARRFPIWMKEAVCDTCKDSSGKPLCRPIYVETRVYKFVGKSKSTGADIWKYQTESIPSMCDCS